MITLKRLEWSNAFSYGENNHIDFDESPLIQLVGENGHGKTSIALILEEVLYSKNSKKVKKAAVLNRHVKAKFYTASLWFSKGPDMYCVEVKRGATQTIKLTKNDEDISAHTATATYALLESILGIDHSTFAQIVFQFSVSSLEFLTTTDSKRKEFLIDLFKLNKYPAIGAILKKALTIRDKELAVLEAGLASVAEQLRANKSVSLIKLDIKPVPTGVEKLQLEIAQQKAILSTADSTNRRIAHNNTYKSILDKLDVVSLGPKPAADISAMKAQVTEAKSAASTAESFLRKIAGLGSVCATCMQPIDRSVFTSLVREHEECARTSKEKAAAIEVLIKEANSSLSVWEQQNKAKVEYENYHALYDPSLPTDLVVQADVEESIRALQSELTELNKKIASVNAANSAAVAHNAKVDLILERNAQLEIQAQELTVKRAAISSKVQNLQVLIKAFSPTGLVAYKLENLVKTLEDTTNEYLVEFSSGRFALRFEIAGSDKLNVVITDQGVDIDILALSTGERARVNIAALLGIRKLLQSISNSRFNLLFLDETIQNLDAQGKEKLVQMLLDEPHLNTVLVSHGFQHPLIEKLEVVKTNNISRIER